MTANHNYRVVLIKKTEQDVVWNMFGSLEGLKSSVYAALLHYLVPRGYLHYGPFDTALNMNATLADLPE